MTGKPDWVTSRELYDKVDETETKLEQKIDANHKEVSDFIGKAKIAFAVLFLLVASPKAGGPSADQVIAGAVKFFA